LEQLQHKIITFLTRNAHLDVEAPDIAFHLKMDEKDVQATLDTLLEKGVVSVQKNQYGRTYWYYVPQRSSMPFETMSTKIPQEISEFIEEQDNTKKGNRFASITLIISVITLLLTIASGIGLFIMVNNKIGMARNEFGNVVSKEELTTVAESAEARLGRVEGELKKTMLKVDSLKNVIIEIKSGSVLKGAGSHQKYYRKR
jgi:predicted transcriptional regulator